MKCWIKYMLPLAMAFCLFLGSSFYSLAAEDQGTGGQTVDYSACITECADLALFIEQNFGDSFYYIGSYNSIYGIDLFISFSPFLFVSSLNNGYSGFYSDTSIFYCRCKSDFTGFKRLGTYDSGSQYLLFDMSTAFSNHDIFYRDSGELFFHQPSPFQRVVQTQDLAAVMMEIVMILPLLILFLTSLIGLRKGLRFVLSFLHRA